MRKKKAQRLSRPIIKKEFYTKRYLKGVSYINPNISKLLERNRKNLLYGEKMESCYN